MKHVKPILLCGLGGKIEPENITKIANSIRSQIGHDYYTIVYNGFIEEGVKFELLSVNNIEEIQLIELQNKVLQCLKSQ